MNNNFFKYLNIRSIEEMWGFFITSVGYSKVEPNQDYPNQKHPRSHQLTWNRGRILNDYYLIFISKGKGIFASAKTAPAEVHTGTCFMLFPGVWHRYKPEIRSGWEEYWVGINGTYAKHLMETGFFSSSHPIITVGLNTELLILFRKLLDIVVASNIGYPQQIAGITLQILGLVNTISCFEAYDNDPVAKLIYKAKFLLQESFENSIDMEDLARQLPMGYSSFRKAFKKITGESPNQYHLKLRLNRAKDLLSSTTLNINEIAYQTGFDSVYYFSKLFKKKNDISPMSFRKQLKH